MKLLRLLCLRRRCRGQDCPRSGRRQQPTISCINILSPSNRFCNIRLEFRNRHSGPSMNLRDVPSPINFHDPAQARAWMERTVRNRPWRPEFFRAFSIALNNHSSRASRVLELGSGPGQLAISILKSCHISQYVALDFSTAMHDLAREQLGPLITKVKFIQRDFRKPEWNLMLGRFDAVVTLQAAHEIRHQDRLPDLLRRTRQCLKTGGLFLYCDHYRGSLKNPVLYLERQRQPETLREAGFVNVKRILDKGGMALYGAVA
jgi:SAM-dependent methyltransferase